MVSLNAETRQILLARLKEIQQEEQLIVERLLDLESAPNLVLDVQTQVEARNAHFESMRDTVISYGDILAPAADPEDWESNR